MIIALIILAVIIIIGVLVWAYREEKKHKRSTDGPVDIATDTLLMTTMIDSSSSCDSFDGFDSFDCGGDF